MKTLANYFLKFTLSVLFIGYIHASNSGIYNQNVVILDGISSWNFRTENDPIYKSEKSSTVLNNEKYFLIDEQDNLSLEFKDDFTYRTRSIKNLLQCNKLNVTYSFDYYLDLAKSAKIIRWTINLLGQKNVMKPEFNKWTSQTKRVEISSNALKTRYRKMELFEMFVNTLDRSHQFRNQFKSKFAIKNLRLIFACDSGRSELKFEFNSNSHSESAFVFKRNNKRLTTNEQIQYWSNLVFPEFSKDLINKYYYTENPFQHLNFEVHATDPGKEEEICITFDYFVTQGAFLKVIFVKNEVEKTLVKLFTSEFNERLLSVEANPGKAKLQWNNATVCIKGNETLENEHNQLPHFSFESFIAKPEMKSDIVAVSNIRIARKNVELKNFIPNWKFNGKSSINSWKTIPQTPNFQLNLTNDLELKLTLRELPSQTRRHYYVISDWFMLNTEIGYLTFKVNSNLTNYHLTLKVVTDESDNLDHKSWSLNNSIENQIFQFNFEKVLKLTPLNSRAKIYFEIYNNIPVGSYRATVSSSGERTFVKHEQEQSLIISEIQLADQCTDELICSNNGNCQALAANKVNCVCKQGWHGSHCEFDNMCIKHVNTLNKTGSEFCKLKDRQCIPEKNNFVCTCKDNEYWNSQIMECEQVTNCNFKACGLNEVCKIDKEGDAICECGKTFFRQNGVCLKDLCSDEKKKCPKNQLCMHMENEVNPICYCPTGTFKQDRDSECIDIRKTHPAIIKYRGTNPFVIQKYDCEQDYVVEGTQVKCACLPGYELSANGVRCEAKFNSKGCNCNENEICIQKGKETECVCRPGYFGDRCEQDICKSNLADNFCDQASCHIDSNHKFFCNCESKLYTTEKNGLCAFKDVCIENQVNCDEQSACFNQKVKDGIGLFAPSKIIPVCGCKVGIGSPRSNDKCADPCEHHDSCNHLPYTECKYLHASDEHRCQCLPGFWRKNILADPCSPVKSSIRLNLIVVPRNTNVNPVRKKDRGGFNLLNVSNALNMAKTIRNSNQIELSSETQSGDLPTYSPVSIIPNACINNLDVEGCIKQWNRAYQAANKLPTTENLAKNYLGSMLRQQLLDTFNVIFEKKIQDVNVVQMKAVNQIDFDNFGLKTFYNVEIVLQSMEIELKTNLINEALQHKCLRASDKESDEKYYECAIGDESILLLNHLKIEEYDLCDSKILECSEFSYCYSRRKEDPTFNPESDQVAYECRCKEGFESTHVNEVGFLSFLNHTCEDIDECKSADLNECDDSSTTCVNLIGGYRCDCDKNYKRESKTHCIELCSNLSCVNGDCRKINDHEDYCHCNDEWTGIKCDKPNGKVKTYRNTIIISIVVAVIILVLVVIGLLFYGRNQTEKRVTKRTSELKRELELVKLDNERILRSNAGAEMHLKHIQEGSDNPAFEGKH